MPPAAREDSEEVAALAAAWEAKAAALSEEAPKVRAASEEEAALAAALEAKAAHPSAVPAAAKAKAAEMLNHYGAGHSVGLHSTDADRAVEMGHDLPTCRVIVNQAHTFATGGSFTNGMPFSLSMGCGSWGGNSIDDNLHWRHFIQTTKVIREIPAREPSLDDVFGAYWAEAGK